MPDEYQLDDKVIGNYGPYVQTKRKEIYDCYAKYMVENDLAYPCFCSEEDLENIRNTQETNKERIGYYGKYAKCRSLSIDEAYDRIKFLEKELDRNYQNGRILYLQKIIRKKNEIIENLREDNIKLMKRGK